jgi:hypothetical protein
MSVPERSDAIPYLGRAFFLAFYAEIPFPPKSGRTINVDMLKEKADRLKEGITLLNRLKEVGCPADNVGFKEVQRVISKWVVDGEAVFTTIPLTRYDRDAVLTLPATSAMTARIMLKKVDE